jgi:hypothetical protein
MGEGVVTRIARGTSVPPDDVSVTLDLLLGRSTELTEEQLELAWEAYVEEIMSNGAGRGVPGTRPWAYWRFELGEDRPDGDHAAIRLAELGLLRDDEIAAIAERANEARPRIGTTAEHYGPNFRPDVRAVELHEAVREAERQRKR